MDSIVALIRLLIETIVSSQSNVLLERSEQLGRDEVTYGTGKYQGIRGCFE
jgi:hypothetical protein